MEAGEKIYVETTLTKEEFQQCKDKYNTYNRDSKYPVFFDSEYKWRYGMGSGFSSSEMNLINERLEAIKKKLL